MAVLWLTHPSSTRHDTGPHHPERAARLDAVRMGVERHGLRDALIAIEAPAATLTDVGAVHDPAMVATLEALCESGGGHVDADTVTVPSSFEAALHAAGAGLEAIARLDAGEGTAAFCAVRPPGHHATRSLSMGFCLLNSVAICAMHLADRGERVMIADIDAHHGNGTQDVFYADPRVLFVSWHQFPLYPGSGRLDETGTGEGLGSTVNLPMPPGATGDRYRAAFDRVVAPVVEDFAPTWLLISAGFDGHRLDPLCDLGLTSGDYADLVADLAALVPAGRVITFLEGGYDLGALADSAAATVASLAGEVLHPEAPTSGGPGAGVVEAATEFRRRSDL